MKKPRIDVFLLHGIAKTVNSRTYFSPLEDRIKKYLPDWRNVHFHPIDYSHLLAEKERIIYSWEKDMGYPSIRKWICDFVCDVLAYGYPARPPTEGDFIYDVTHLLQHKYDQINEMHPFSKKVLIGHSLGSIIGFSFTWCRHFDLLCTIGSPFNRFSVRYKGFGEDNIELKRWRNYWKRYDLIATRPSKNPNFRRVEEVQVKSWNPRYIAPWRAHSAYFCSDQMAKDIARELVVLNFS